ncbi:uncharacterized protein ARMOST_08696 [Armillaria ostoyae]|uniref:Heterokaryon incompatibility domain-containing protein n=1 Tax=Armillaria ostoyae TaxID=47428 RepID=A0A284R9F3_ARMOS|nr:uncharacterized protein ARMOST_08696 [Armillaria ostoyae]
MFLYYARSAWEYVKLKIKIAVDERMRRKELHKLLEDELGGRTRQFPEVMISSQTETRQTEESITVPNQRVYIGREPVIFSSLANNPCSCLGIQGLLDLLNTTLGTSYTLETPSLSSVLEDCFAQEYDFGTAYGRLRSVWYNQRWRIIQEELQEREAKDVEQRRKAVKGRQIVHPNMKPRRVWDLYSNRVVPWWSCGVSFGLNNEARPISHAWVDEVDRVDVWTPINGYEWPVPIPKGANLNLIRIEMLNLGMEYAWLDVLCLRQVGGWKEGLREEEWKLDVPTIGAIYRSAQVVWYLSGLGLPLTLKAGDLESDRCWFRRAWTVQEIGWSQTRTIAGDTPDGPLHTESIDEAGNYEDAVLLRNFHKQLESARIPSGGLYGVLSVMQDRISTNPVDKVAGLAFSLETLSIPAYYKSQSLEDAWTAFIDEMEPGQRGDLFFTYPEPGIGSKKWRPSWKQVMDDNSLPKDSQSWIANVLMNSDAVADDWCDTFHIERGFVRGLAVGGAEGIDRRGKLVVEDADGVAHSFNILASHQFPIPEDTYALLGNDPASLSQIWGHEIKLRSSQHWVVGRQLPTASTGGKRFKKVSVFKMTDLNEIKRLRELGLSELSRSILT